MKELKRNMAVSTCGTTTDPEGREMKRHGSLSFPVACYHDDLRKAPVPWHWHDELEAAVVSEGSVVLAVDSQKIKIEKGDGFFINTGILHAAWNADETKDSRLHSLVFHARLIGGDGYSVFWEKYLNPLMQGARFLRIARDEEWQRQLLDAIERAWHFCKSEGYGHEFFIRHEMSRFVLLLGQRQPARSRSLSPSELRSQERVKTMLLFIHEHFAENPETKQIAGSAAISESECLRCFHKVIGTTPIQYLKQYRLRMAEHLLGTTDGRISDIAARCGFQETGYFSRSFREKNAMTPSEYRAEIRETQGRGR